MVQIQSINFAEDKVNVTENMKFVLERVENMLW